MSNSTLGFLLLLEFKYNSLIVFNKKIKLDSIIKGQILKNIIADELNVLDNISKFEISRISVLDRDFITEYVDITDEDLFTANQKIFIELSLKRLENSPLYLMILTQKMSTTSLNLINSIWHLIIILLYLHLHLLAQILV